MKFSTRTFFPIDSSLATFVEVYREVRVFEEIEGDTVANGRLDIIITLKGKIETLDESTGKFNTLPRCYLSPLTKTGFNKFRLAPGTVLLNVKLYPHLLSLPLFHKMGSTRTENFSEVFHRSEDLEKLTLEENLLKYQRVLDQFFERQFLVSRNMNGLLRDSIAYIESEKSALQPVDLLAETLNVSRKTLDRHFKTHMGLTVKIYRDLIRFQYAAKRIKQNGQYDRGNMLEALDSGYYDQSHFVKACRKLTGKSPKEVFSKMPAEVTDFIIS